MKKRTHIGARALLAGGVLSLAVGLAFVRAEEPGFTYATETIDLKIDSQASYRGAPWPSGTWGFKDLKPHVDKFWKFNDIKPGDWGENTISLHNKSKKDPLYVCLTFFNLLNGENGINEPESHVDSTPNTGELTKGMEFFAWHDDGDNIFEPPAEKPLFGTSTPQSANPLLAGKTYPLYDYKHNGSIPVGGKRYFGVYWCAGDLQVNTTTGQIICNGEALGNEAQTDTMKVDVELTAVSAKDKPKFECKDVKPPKPPKPPKGEVCEDVTVVVNNSSTVVSNTTSSTNTGGNTTNGGMVTTGNATSTATSTNIVNTTVIQMGNSSGSSSIFDLFKKKK